jgi:hypothetical protein
MMMVHMELSVGWTRTCSLDNVFTRYLFGAMTLSSSNEKLYVDHS